MRTPGTTLHSRIGSGDSDPGPSGKPSRRVRGTLLSAVLLLFSACDLLEMPAKGAVDPVLSDLEIPAAIYLETDRIYPVSVRAEDPQGLETVIRIRLRILPPGGGADVLDAAMADDGQTGDILPGDGLFFYGLTTAVTGNAGRFRVEVTAEDADGNFSDTLIDTLEVVEGEENRPPVVRDPAAPDSLDEATAGDVFLSVEAEDPQGRGDIDSVFFRFYPPHQPAPSFASRMYDDGSNGDGIAGDGRYSFRGDLREVLTARGDCLFSFHASDRGGLSSHAVVVGFFMDAPNRPPALSSLTAPDSVSRNRIPSFLLSVRADDPQGPEDVRIVYFLTTKPDGTPSDGNPFEMKDNGTGGDETAYDGLYSLRVEISPDNALGAYRFDFFAEDQSGATSPPLTHTIVVID